MKRTKIVCTMGPSCEQPDILAKMIRTGMNVARFNFSHGSHAEHEGRMTLVREVAAREGKHVALLLDTKGPEMRLGTFSAGKVELVAGEPFVLTTEIVDGTAQRATVNYPGLPADVKPGMQILLADGLVCLEIEAVKGTEIFTRILNTGVMGDRKRVAVPGASIGLPPLSEADVADLLFGVKMGIDFVAASFVQRGSDVLAIRKVLEEAGAPRVQIIAKIENAEGVNKMEEILAMADGIMVARGDLGVEIPAEEVPLVQKTMIAACNRAGKPVITATQMLESMVQQPRPTRAEASDVANAIFDGTDAIMLSGETAGGKYPVEAVETMARIAERTEAALPYQELLRSSQWSVQRTTTDAISFATVSTAQTLEAQAIVTDTVSGNTAQMVAKHRPACPIIAVTPDLATVRRLQLIWGVQPILGQLVTTSDERVEGAVGAAMAAGCVKEGDLVVVTAGVPRGGTGSTNMIRVHVIGEVLLKGTGLGGRIAAGRVCLAHTAAAAAVKFEPGDILVVKGLEKDLVPYASQAKAIIAEAGGLTSEAAILGVSLGIPVLVGAQDALATLEEGMSVTVDTLGGQVYRGEINVR